jgi:hypothetical protein
MQTSSAAGQKKGVAEVPGRSAQCVEEGRRDRQHQLIADQRSEPAAANNITQTRERWEGRVSVYVRGDRAVQVTTIRSGNRCRQTAGGGFGGVSVLVGLGIVRGARALKTGAVGKGHLVGNQRGGHQ